jgi:putative SOS response-associated peptidase YedK
MALAELWETWRAPAGERVRSLALITARADELCAAPHDRMPVLLSLQSWPAWFGEEPAGPAQLKAMLAPYPLDEMTCGAMSPRVGNIENNDASVIEPIAASKGARGLSVLLPRTLPKLLASIR